MGGSLLHLAVHHEIAGHITGRMPKQARGGNKCLRVILTDAFSGGERVFGTGLCGR